MTFALTKFRAYGIEIDEPITTRFKQWAHMTITAANTDASLDISNLSGTFWTAVGSTAPGINALYAIKSIQQACSFLVDVQGEALLPKSRSGLETSVLLSTAGAGGSATAVAVVTGLTTTDTIVAVTQKVKGANGTALNGWNTQAANALTLTYTGDPGAGSIVEVAILREGGTVNAGEYQIAVTSHLPTVLFSSGDAPTAYDLLLSWELMTGSAPINITG